jgi:hypothetical protein
VKHSALKEEMKWGKPNENGYENPKWTESQLNIMQLYADWYTLLIASAVYHTFSDFSLSAVHWNNVWSRTYDGIDAKTGLLKLQNENWVVDGESKPLVKRNTAELRNCDKPDLHFWEMQGAQ